MNAPPTFAGLLTWQRTLRCARLDTTVNNVGLFEEVLADELRLPSMPPTKAPPAPEVTPQRGTRRTKESLLKKLMTTPPTLTPPTPPDVVKDKPALDSIPISTPRDKTL